MNSSDIAKVLNTNPKAIFAITLGRGRGMTYSGRILKTHENIVSVDKYGYSLSNPRRVTTYTVELILEEYNVTPVTYVIKQHRAEVRPNQIMSSTVLDTKTLEQLCEERTQNEREYRKRMATDAERKKELLAKLVQTVNISEYELRTLTLESLEKLVKALGNNSTDMLVSTQEA